MRTLVEATQNKFPWVGTFAVALVMLAACKTVPPMTHSDDSRGTVDIYTSDDERSAMPEPKNQRPVNRLADRLEDQVKESPKDIKATLALAQVRVLQEKFEDAEMLCQQALRIDLKNETAKTMLAQIAMHRRNYNMASMILESIGGPTSKDSKVLNMLALIALNRHDNARAMALFKQALQVNPDDLAVRMNLGVLHLRYRQLAQASTQFERVLKSMPEHRDARLHLAIMKAVQNRNEEAEDIYTTILAEKDENPLALFNLAVIEKRTGRLDEAIDHLKRYLKSRPAEGSQASEAFAMIEQIQSERAAKGQAISDEEIQELAAKMDDSRHEKTALADTNKKAPAPQQNKAAKKPAQASEEINDLEKIIQ